MADRNVVVMNPVEIKGKNGMSLNMIPAKASAVTITAKVIYTIPALVYVGTGGNVAIIPWDDPNANVVDPTGWVLFKNIPDGSFLQVYAKRIGAAGDGTSATDLVVCF